MSDSSKSGPGRERLVESLWQDARREADQELQKARAEAERLQDENRNFRDKEISLAHEKARIEAMPHAARILNRARNRVRQLLLEGRYSFLDSCFEEAGKAIRSDDSLREKVRAILPDLLTQALDIMGQRDDLQVRLNPADVKSVRMVFTDKGLSTEIIADKNISGGAMLTCSDGSMIVDATIDGRLNALRETPPVALLNLIAIGDSR